MVEGQRIVGTCSPVTSYANPAEIAAWLDLFYCDPDEEPELVELARTICGNCPARLECLDMNMSEEFGIFGGMTAAERKDMRNGRITRPTASSRAPGT